MNQDPNETPWQPWRGTEPKTVAGLLRRHLEDRPDALAYRFLAGTGTGTGTGSGDGTGGGESWSYRELDLRTRAVAALLQREGLTGKPVLLLRPPGLDYIAGFLGCLYAGAIAVPAYPPDTRRFGQTMPRLAAIARDSGATHALTTGALSRFAATKRREMDSLGLAGLRWLALSGPGTDGADDWRDPSVGSDSTAFLQYTSGSTASPKGVMVSNGNLLHNLRSIQRRLEHDAASGMVSWLPPYHDMGLIGGILTPLYGGFPAHLMSAMSFVRQPLLWLETLSRTRASTSVAPNFGFEHCVRRITDEQRDGLDLSHWRLALNGAEPVRADTLDLFAERFAPCGFERRALLPCYGLAEATLMVTGVGAHEPPPVGAFASAALGTGIAASAPEPSEHGPSVPPATSVPESRSERAIRLVGCGPAVDGVDIAIVDTGTRRRIGAEGHIGEIWIAGGSVAHGYWGRPETTEDTFRARIEGEGPTPFLRTGDLGFLKGGHLHVVGRIKDVVIVQGRNHYPQDVERTVERADEAIRPGSGAAFSIEVDGAEELVVVHEVEGRRLDGAPALLARLRTAIAEEHDVAPHAVVLLKRSTVHKTTSGKIQRQACKRDFLALGLTVVAAGVTRNDAEVPLSAGNLTGLPAAARRQRVADAVTEVLTGVPATADAPDITGRAFVELGLDYPALLTAVRLLEERLGTRIPVGALLARPRVDTLIGLFLGTEPGDAPASRNRAADLRKQDAAEAWLVEQVATRLGLPAASVDVTRPLASLGLDSKQSVAILAELGARTGREMSTGAAFEHPTIRAVAAHVGAAGRAADAAGTAVSAGAAATPSRQPSPQPSWRRDTRQEPIAIIGMGCRFPGAPDPDSYWRLLVDGRDAITGVPGDRWASEQVDAPAFGGFLDRVDEFDARFFGLSAREALRMDPQQRLLLETAWQTVEDAGLDPTGLAGSATGVFVGISSHDYSALQMSRLETIDVHAATGNAHSIAANRLSYTLDLRGPSLAVDTACSSSLLAVHLACEAIRRGECDTALAGGVNLLLSPGLSVAFAQGNMLSPDGRCRTFDDSANGYVRGEGVGLVLLKPLAAALADGDPVHAVVRGSATAHGGRSNGLTAPKGSAQRAVIERALDRAGLSGSDIDYVEAHGTGTSLGDPVEWEGLTAAYGSGRPEGGRCLVGSVKTNIGHLESAAGIAGLIKAALVVRHRQVPPTLHLRTPNRHLAWDSAGLDVPTRLTGLPDTGSVRAGVSSFGFGGANAHVVLESAPEPGPLDAVAPKRPTHALCLSAHTPTALTTLAQRWRTHLAAHPDAELADLCRTAGTGRAQLAFRAVVTGGSQETFDHALDALARGGPSAAVVRGRTRPGPAPKVAFLFSGQGTQYTGMGKGLYGTHSGFARTLERADRVLRPHLGVPLTELLFGEGYADRLASTRYCQAALVALEVALAELWISLGVRPTALLGHSVGAYGAACVAGVMSLEDALTLAVVRGGHMAGQPGDGAMIACAGDEETIRAAVADGGAVEGGGAVAVAAVNAPGHLVLSGDRTEIDRVRARLEDRSVVVRPLAVSHAFHSPLMAGAAQPLRAAAQGVAFRPPEIPWVSDTTGELVTGPVGADDWARHMLGPVRFADGFATLRRLGCDAFVEIGPHPALLSVSRTMTAPDDEESVLWLPSLRRARGGPAGDGDWQTLLQSLGRLHCAGGSVDWAALDEGARRPRVPVPHAVLEGRPYWFSPPSETDTAAAGGLPDPVAVRTPAAPPSTPSGAAPDGRAEPGPARSAPAAGGGRVRGEVVDHVARACAFPPEQIPLDARLGADLGFDSLMRTELERSLARRFPGRLDRYRKSLPEDPTVGQLVALLDTGDRPPLPGDGTPPAAVRRPRPVAPAGPVLPGDGAGPPVKQERAFEEWAEYAELRGRLRQTTASGSNPYGRVHEGHNSGRVTLGGRPVINFASFNYLALSHHPRVRGAAREAIDRYGTSSSATPLLFGETPLHHELDAEIASFLGTEAAIVFAGGHATNVATIGHLFGPEDLVLHDEWIHDSALRGCMLSGARRRPFPHNDWRALDSMLDTLRSRHRRALVLIEGAYSQDGDLPDLRRFIEVKARHGAMLMVDEAHSIGVLGRTGRGIGEYFGVERRDVDLWMGTLSKALGSLGGYVAAREPIIEYLRFTAPLHIFSTGISPANTAAALEAIRVVRDEPQRVARVRRLAEHFRDSARARGFDIGVSRASAVIPVVIGDWEKTMALSNTLLERGVNVMPIGYPAVARDECRLRFFINADHSEEDLEHSLDLLGRAMSEHTHTPPSPGPAARPGTAEAERPAAREPAIAPALLHRHSAGTAADVLVAGASGFIGGHLTRRLTEHGHRVRVLVREGSDRTAFAGADVEVATGDLSDPESLRRATAGVRHVYNCAGLSADWGPWEEFRRINVDGSRHLVEAAHHAGTVERLLHLSTTDVYGYPVTPCDESAEPRDIGLPYNRSKVLGELAVRQAAERTGLPVTVVRPVSVYGPRSKDFVIEIATLLLGRQMVYVRGGAVPAGLVYVGNLVDGLIAACASEATVGKAYNMRDPDPTTWREYVEALARGLGVKPPAFSLPTPVARGVATVSEKLYGALGITSRPVLTRHAVHLFDRDQSYAIDRARDDFGFKSEVGFEEGIELTLAWLDSPEGRALVTR
ncbi:type I polyketide synthase [Streptomyces paludis]|uniref:Aminotransferase class I/II-fold pyridoxal phosphate-dependent enzyme n=1 Tax=Streptomyces paludis TaxID=2282738 RepID=A0A345HXH1_9ACTN|nr:type I polyketide synthase [Streptomyces paludis]AXG81395.1 aminotransferase class I/II-fold pyridoxal phosphate-dependent enzyme [Streptomyces paludis]